MLKNQAERSESKFTLYKFAQCLCRLQGARSLLAGLAGQAANGPVDVTFYAAKYEKPLRPAQNNAHSGANPAGA